MNEVSTMLLEKLAQKARSLDVLKVDFQRILLVIVQGKSPFGKTLIVFDGYPELLKLKCCKCLLFNVS